MNWDLIFFTALGWIAGYLAGSCIWEIFLERKLMQHWNIKNFSTTPRIGSTIIVGDGNRYEIVNGVSSDYLELPFERMGGPLKWVDVKIWRYLDVPEKMLEKEENPKAQKWKNLPPSQPC